MPDIRYSRILPFVPPNYGNTMVTVASLWLPILLSAVVVFIASSIIHMVFTYHQSDFRGLPDEDGIREALKPFTIPPGDYMIPHADTMKESQTEEYMNKAKQGPVALLTVWENAPPTLGKSLMQWFVFCLLVSINAAYLAGAANGPGAYYLDVFRFAGTVSFLAYGFGLIQNSIWNKKSWRATFYTLFDSLIFGLLTAGIFGWLWP